SEVPDADVTIATWWETAEWVAALGPAKGAKAYFIQHDETVFWPEGALAERRRVVDTWRLPMRKFVVARWLADLARERGIPDRFDVVPNAVDHDLFDAPPRGRRERPTVGFVYSRTRFKGCDTALRAIAEARQRLPELAVVAFGLDAPGPDLP